MKTTRATALAALSLSLSFTLTACGGGSPDGADPKASSQGTSSASPPASAAPRKPIPKAFDNTKGWTAVEKDDQDNQADLGMPTFAPDAGLLLLRQTTGFDDKQTSHIVARDAKTGESRWSGKPMPTQTPANLYVTHKDGKEYAVLVTSGTEGEDAVNKGTQVTRIATYDTAASKGEQAAPVKETTIPGGAADVSVPADGGIAVLSGEDLMAVVDVVSGKVTTHDKKSPALKSPKPCPQFFGACDDRPWIIGQAKAGLLVQGEGAFWVAGGWFAEDVAPAGATPSEGMDMVEPYPSPDGNVVASWPIKDGMTSDEIWAVHDGSTGKVLATVTCKKQSNTEVTPFRSPDGRYLVADLAVFDLKAKRGHCTDETDDRARIEVKAVDSDGTAYGEAPGTAPVSFSLATGKAAELPEGTMLPDMIGADAAVFSTEDGVLVYPRR
ncbi:hypothetical protein [Streptomyces sp. NPDC000410]|uniref:hypothetical protein n=1 Tax=Streptomyces sp. NPDC000410 TaxID=3154254 RepID=UPI00332CBAD7